MDTENKEKFKEFQRLGSELIERGKFFLNRATEVNKTIYTAVAVTNLIRENTGVLPVLYDQKYHLTDIAIWKTIIENDWTNKKKWTTDIFDCDNFAGAFCAYCADIYGLNSAGRFTVELLDPKTDKHIGYHRAVIIIDRAMDCWLLESQTDKMVKIEKGVDPVIDNWKYKVNYISMN